MTINEENAVRFAFDQITLIIDAFDRNRRDKLTLAQRSFADIKLIVKRAKQVLEWEPEDEESGPAVPE